MEEMLPFTASPALAIMLLNNFLWLLESESDVTKVRLQALCLRYACVAWLACCASAGQSHWALDCSMVSAHSLLPAALSRPDKRLIELAAKPVSVSTPKPLSLPALPTLLAVLQVHWAQYMEVDVASNGTALLDYQGNARPAWHAFKFWGDLPIERAVRPLCRPSPRGSHPHKAPGLVCWILLGRQAWAAGLPGQCMAHLAPFQVLG